jgi:NTP pyrophosphatase (non-canonical NTP hydrolase)
MGDDSLDHLGNRLRTFASARSWERYHTPKNLTTAIAGEAGELAAVLQWADPDDDLMRYRADLEEEMADVLIYLVRLADVLDVDLISAANAKIDIHRDCDCAVCVGNDLGDLGSAGDVHSELAVVVNRPRDFLRRFNLVELRYWSGVIQGHRPLLGHVHTNLCESFSHVWIHPPQS